MARALAVVCLVLAMTGCGVGGGSLVRREVVVVFQPNAPQDEHMAARTACTGTPNSTPEPLPTSTAAISTLNNVRFRVDRASDADLVLLYDCLRRQRGVLGVRPPTVG